MIMQWLTMQGYGSYIWSAYGIVAVFLIGQLCALPRYRKRIQQQLQQWFREQ